VVSQIRGLVANARMQVLVIVVVKIGGDAGLGLGQVGKNGPLAGLEFFGFGPRPEAFGLRIIVALAAPAL